MLIHRVTIRRHLRGKHAIYGKDSIRNWPSCHADRLFSLRKASDEVENSTSLGPASTASPVFLTLTPLTSLSQKQHIPRFGRTRDRSLAAAKLALAEHALHHYFGRTKY